MVSACLPVFQPFSCRFPQSSHVGCATVDDDEYYEAFYFDCHRCSCSLACVHQHRAGRNRRRLPVGLELRRIDPFVPEGERGQGELLRRGDLTEVDKDSNWGGLGSMDVPQTKSTAEKEAEARAKPRRKALSSVHRKRPPQRRHVSRPRPQAAARRVNPSPTPMPTPPSRKPLRPRSQQLPHPCPPARTVQPSPPMPRSSSAPPMYRVAPLRAAGIALDSSCMSSPGSALICRAPRAPRPVSEPPVPSLAEAQPGDIIANANHAAIYIGNGMIVNALNPAQGTQVTNLSAFGGAAYSIRRVL